MICDHIRADGAYVAESPRSVLRRQLELLERKGFTCCCASELEFYLFNQSYHSAFTSGDRLDWMKAEDGRISGAAADHPAI